jgi:hypothetical protein
VARRGPAGTRDDETDQDQRCEADDQRQGLEPEVVPGRAGVIPSPAA